MTKAASVLLGLLKSSLGYEYSGVEMRLLSCADWNRLVDLAFDNGVAALVVDGLGFAHDNDDDNDNSLELSVESNRSN